MDYIQGADRHQTHLFPASLEEYVTPDNPVRFIDAYVESLDVEELGFTHAQLASTGRPPYRPQDLLKLYIYGYLHKIRSSRALERETHRNIELLWLMGKLQPDFKTIADFRKNNTEPIKAVCTQFIVLCKKMELFGGELVAIDGSKFEAVNHSSRSYTRKGLQQALAATKQQLQEWLNQLDTTDQKEPGEEPKESLEQKITQPLGLKNTYYGGKINPQKMEAFSYTLETPLIKSEETDLSIPAAAGAMVSTSADLLKFIQDLFNHKIISEKSLSKMTTMTDNYGFGIFSVPFYNTSGFGHNGGIDAFTSALYYFPELKAGYVMLSNGTAFDNNQITIAAMSLATGKNIEIPNFTAANVDPAILQKYAGIYSSAQIPIKIEVSEKDGQLFAQATGQGEFPLEAKSESTFTFDTAGIKLDFDSEKKTMKLLQGGMEILFTKE